MEVKIINFIKRIFLNKMMDPFHLIKVMEIVLQSKLLENLLDLVQIKDYNQQFNNQ